MVLARLLAEQRFALPDRSLLASANHLTAANTALQKFVQAISGVEELVLVIDDQPVDQICRQLTSQLTS